MASTRKMQFVNRSKLEAVVLAKIQPALHEAIEEALKPKSDRKHSAVQVNKAPREGGKCRAVWDALDAAQLSGAAVTLATATSEAESHGWNKNNARTEFYRWKAFRLTHPLPVKPERKSARSHH